MPDIIVQPPDTEDVKKIVEIANNHKIPVFTRAGGTSMAGGSVARKGILLDTRKMNRILEIDEENLTVTVQAGIPIQTLNEALVERGYWVPLDPESKATTTIGTNIALRSDSTFGIRYGKVEQWLCSCEIVTGKGDIIDVGHNKTLISSSGYHLHWLIISSEGTLGIITEATLRIIPRPPMRMWALMQVPSLEKGVQCVIEAHRRGIFPESVNILDKERLINYSHPGSTVDIRRGHFGIGYSFSGEEVIVSCSMQKMGEIIQDRGGRSLAEGRKDSILASNDWWDHKHVVVEPPELQYESRNGLEERGLKEFEQNWPILQRKKRFGAAGMSLPIGRIPEAYQYFHKTAKKYNLEIFGMNVYFQLPNATHVSISFAVKVGDSQEEVDNFYKYHREMSELAVRLEGSMSAYPGDGEVTSSLNKIEHKEAREYMCDIKRIFDPNNILNPGKKFGETGKEYGLEPSPWIPPEEVTA